MKAGTLLSISLASLAGLAQAQCLDTLYLKELTVFHMSVVNSKAAGNWDSVSLNPWSEEDLKLARRASFGAAEHIYVAHSNAIKHPRTLYFSCGTDSSSRLESVIVRDTFYRDRDNAPVTSTVIERRDETVKINKQMGVYYVVSGKQYDFDFVFDAAGEEGIAIGRQKGSAEIQAWASSPLAFYFDTTKYLSVGVPHPVEVVGTLVGALREFAVGPLEKGLSAISPYVDLIGKGLVDSTRFEMKLFRYTYSRQNPQSASIHFPSRTHSMEQRFVEGVLRVQLEQPSFVSIISPSGRVVRRLDAARNVVWDLKDQAGVRVQPGVWFVQVQGLKTVPVVVR